MEAVSPIFGLRLWFGWRDYLLLQRRVSILFWPCCKQLLLQHFPVIIFQPPWELKQKDSDPTFLTLDMSSVCVTHNFATFLGIQGVFHYVAFLIPRILKDRSALLHVNKCFLVPWMCNTCPSCVLNKTKTNPKTNKQANQPSPSPPKKQQTKPNQNKKKIKENHHVFYRKILVTQLWSHHWLVQNCTKGRGFSCNFTE